MAEAGDRGSGACQALDRGARQVAVDVEDAHDDLPVQLGDGVAGEDDVQAREVEAEAMGPWTTWSIL